MQPIVAYIPIFTTVFAIYFIGEITRHYKKRNTSYLLWWSIGVFAFGLGTFAESIHALFGWNEVNVRLWYIVGALLGGFPLAQGSVYLLMSRWFAHVSSVFFIVLILVASYYVTQTPFEVPLDFDYQLTGRVFKWTWVRQFSPIINIYSFIFLFGGAIYSATKYYGSKDKKAHFKGNIFIAFGALLPGIGGTFTRLGHVEVLFITEFIGLIFIYIGYRIIKNDNRMKRESLTNITA
jgi:hypothetical protein